MSGTALRLIAAERKRQIDAEGYTIQHDRAHGPVVLQQAARCYAQSSRSSGVWPWTPDAWKPKGPLRNLLRAGALYQAAIDVCEANPGYVEFLRESRDEVAARLDALLDDARELLRLDGNPQEGQQQ